MTRTMHDQPSVVRRTSVEAARRMAANSALRPSLSAEGSERSAHRLVGSALRLGAILLMLPLGLALAMGGAWQTVLWMGALLLAVSVWTVYEDASERRKVEAPGGVVQPQPSTQPTPVRRSLN